MSALEQVQHVIAATLNVAEDKITAETSDQDIAAWDSLAHVNLMMTLEQTFDVMLEVEDFPILTSVPAIVKYLQGQGIH